ncbi:MAG: hypothetical protein MUC38_11625 [Cyclobacteriaceae bacterium]|nr:hypothetical protein [Cyclobacteriaceae bacterium]
MIRLSFFLLLAWLPASLHAQGCSDSGFCTMGSLKPDQIYVPKHLVRVHALEMTYHYGRTEQDDHIHAAFMDVVLGLGKRITMQVRLPAYAVIRGDMPTTQGWGDYFLNVSHVAWQRRHYQIALTAGAKFYNRAQDPQQSENGLDMPLYHQTSLRTDDLNAGITVASRKWMAAVAYRKPVRFDNGAFHHEPWAETPLAGTVARYAPSRGLVPGDDLMMRVERSFRLARWTFGIGSLNLYRLRRDRVVDADGMLRPQGGTEGLASSVVVSSRYRFDVKNSVRLLASQRVADRDLNPDGLARTFVAQLAFEHRF